MLGIKSSKYKTLFGLWGDQLFFKFVPFLFVSILLNSLSASAQNNVDRLHISHVDLDSYPIVTFRLGAFDQANQALSDFSGLQLFEDNKPLEDFSLEQIPIGSEIVFVIDANTTIDDIDELDGPNRLVKVQESITRYANRFINSQELDRVSIVVPDGGDGRFLSNPGMSTPGEIVAAIEEYGLGEVADTALNNMLELALDQMEGEQESDGEAGRQKSILLFTDGAQLGQQLNYGDLVSRAQQHDAAIYVAILGKRADPNEIENILPLTEPTGGAYVHMPNSIDGDALFSLVQRRSNPKEITYRSSLDNSGAHTLAAEIGDVRAESSFDLVVEAPQVSLLVDNSQPIVRTGEDEQTPLGELMPKILPLVANINWPDDHPRLLTEVSLWVNGVEKKLEPPVLSDDGSLTFSWEIGDLDRGVHNIQVQVTDELGLQGTSQEVPLEIDIRRTEAQVTPVSTPTPTTSSNNQGSGFQLGDLQIGGLQIGVLVNRLIDRVQENQTVVAAGGAIFLTFLVFFFIAIIIIRRRRSKSLEGTESAQSLDLSVEDSSLESVLYPDQDYGEAQGIYLEPLEFAAEHINLIPINGDNMTLGRDPKVVETVFEDKSVSRLHARIVCGQGVYRIYDEGSSSGTYVNFERLGLAPRILNIDDHIHLGRVHLRFRVFWKDEDEMSDGLLETIQTDIEPFGQTPEE